ncbi:leucyl/phenylalanyl-tRNA--protein transferase [Qingshengfaniella alkalisoli]|uniref:Leucyl/phenylalanyl-tRNA--protein transferase n=1 Tax=Qingshengfaniella alkalisoli TaxID=2599296 RepID=A0A5B8IVI3_9RHOB|nr:leucyl/phenylalanyl-tRNA--protein transferase [Qingshengfaniella alkalisoli]QDY68508.1 leucyl/phenylalanyl-tRNA--protein transferase [Qingshengfaniella alkalisoli]
METLTPDLLLQAYAMGVFPMAQSRDDPEIYWVDPDLRGVIPLGEFRVSRSLARRIRKTPFQVSFDTAFEQTVSGCADRSETWINDTIHRLYSDLFSLGFAHSAEVWDQNDLVGGVYGVSLGGAFFGESMFSRRTDASKIALTYLIDRLKLGGYRLFDTQFVTEHLLSLGAIEIPRQDYKRRLSSALNADADFNRGGKVPGCQAVLQRMTHTS